MSPENNLTQASTIGARRSFAASRPHVVVVMVLCVLAGACSSERDPVESDSVAIQLNWYPEVEHGGVYQAVADDLYETKVDIRPGGRSTNVAAELQMDRAQFAITNADDVVLARRRGGNLVAVAAVCQNSPRCILVRKDSGIQNWDDSMDSMTLQRQPGRLFLPYLESMGKLDGVRKVPYAGGVVGLASDPKTAIQAYLFSEPLMARQAGIEVTPLMVSDLGWNPYASVLVTTDEMIRQRPEMVASFVDATLRGWQNYLRDPAAGNAAILAANREGMTQEILDYGVQQLGPLALPDSLPPSKLGMMTPQRWEELVGQIESLTEESSDVRAEDCFTLQFLPPDPL